MDIDDNKVSCVSQTEPIFAYDMMKRMFRANVKVRGNEIEKRRVKGGK
jgi:hypothetical protein